MSNTHNRGSWRAKGGHEQQQQLVMLCLAVINHLCFVSLILINPRINRNKQKQWGCGSCVTSRHTDAHARTSWGRSRFLLLRSRLWSNSQAVSTAYSQRERWWPLEHREKTANENRAKLFHLKTRSYENTVPERTVTTALWKNTNL